MAIESKTKKTYIADGTQSVFLFPFDYLRKSFVFVTLNGSALLQGTDFSIVNKQATFSTAPVGTLIIYRETATSPLVSWSDGSVLLASDMTVQMIQSLHLAEETADKVGVEITGLVEGAVAASVAAAEAAASAEQDKLLTETAKMAAEQAAVAAGEAEEAALAAAAGLNLPMLIEAANKYLKVNEAGNAYVLADLNLSDKEDSLGSPPSDNMVLASLADGTRVWVQPSAVPTGAVFWFPAVSPPSGFIKANGAILSRTIYADLFSVMGVVFGAGDGSTTFAVVDLRGEFVRGWADNRAVDTGRVFGSSQLDAFQGHYHNTYPNAVHNESSVTGLFGTSMGNYRSTTLGPITDGTNGTPRTANETRGRNVALLPCIKY